MNNLITEKQMKMMHALLNILTKKEAEVERYKQKIKDHYNIPSTWQLTREQANKILDRLQELVEKGKADDK